MTWRGGNEDHWKFNTRPNASTVVEVRPEKGMMRVRPKGHASAYTATIPQLGLTFKGARSSWVRYMPDEGAEVQVAQNPQGRWEGLGYTHWSPTPGFNDGYGNVTAQAEAGENGYRQFRPLGLGEFDARSSGGAYMRGDRLGVLALEGQASSIRLHGPKDEVQVEAELTRIEANGGSFMRLGEVKRTLAPTLYKEQTINVPGGGSLTAVTGANTVREWSVEVAASSPLATFRLYSRTAGDVRDGFGLPILDLRTGNWVRDQEDHYLNDGILTALNRRVDNLGKVTWTQGIAAAAGAPAIPGVSATVQGLALTAPVGNVAVILPGAGTGSQLIQLGSLAAVEPAVLGATWAAARATLNGNIATFLEALVVSMPTIAAAFSAPTIAQPAAASAATAVGASAGILLGQVLGFEGGSAAFLSRTVLLT